MDLQTQLRKKADEYSNDSSLFDLLVEVAEFVEHAEWKLDRIDDRIDAIEETLAMTIARVLQENNP